MLWQPDRITYFIDRQPVSEIKVPVGFDDPMYMIVNLAMGSKILSRASASSMAYLPIASHSRSTGYPAYQIDCQR